MNVIILTLGILASGSIAFANCGSCSGDSKSDPKYSCNKDAHKEHKKHTCSKDKKKKCKKHHKKHAKHEH